VLDEHGLRLLAAEIETKMDNAFRWSEVSDYAALQEWASLPVFVRDRDAPC
jgi:hypothetical protein